MKIDNKKHLLAYSIIFLYILLFPFGQLLRYEFTFAGKLIAFLAIDIIAGFSLLLSFFLRKPKIVRSITPFFISCVFSLILSLSFFRPHQVLMGSLYLVRLMAHSSLFILIRNLVVHKKLEKEFIIEVLTVSLTITALLGWLQYIHFSDLTYMKYAGWDDHLGRLVGTFLDPAFTGMIILAGFFIVFLKYIYNGSRLFLLLSFLFLITLLFTYSRATYGAFLLAIGTIYYWKRKFSVIFFFLLIFLLALPLLPRARGEGVRLERTKSINLRFENYRETIKIIKNAPLFGVGYNNLCWIREGMFSDSTRSHSCSGSDSSLLLIIATTGLVGFLLFINLIRPIIMNISKGYYGDLTKIYLCALLFHSFFSNSLIYPWLIGLTSIFLSISSKERN